MPEWVIEQGIGETRAALIDNDEIVEARVRREGVTPARAIIEGQLIAIAPRVTVKAGGEQFLLPRGASVISEGRTLRIEVTREALGGAEPWKRGLARLVPSPAVAGEGDREAVEGHSLGTPPPATLVPLPSKSRGGEGVPLAEGREGKIEGWDDLLEEARSGIVRFEGGELRIEPTAAMTMIDVDGWLVPDRLGQMAAWAAARAIRRLDMGGPIGIDFPTLRDRAERRVVDEVLGEYLPKPFEKTAMNGFGFVQVVRPKQRASLIDLAADRAAFEARALLRRAGSEVGAIRLVGHPAVIRVLEAKAEWIERLGRQVGGSVGLRAEPKLAMSGGYAEPA